MNYSYITPAMLVASASCALPLTPFPSVAQRVDAVDRIVKAFNLDQDIRDAALVMWHKRKPA